MTSNLLIQKIECPKRKIYEDEGAREKWTSTYLPQNVAVVIGSNELMDNDVHRTV